MPACVTNVAPCITQVAFQLVHYALLINQLWFCLTFFKVLANFPTDKYFNTFINSRVADQQPLQPSGRLVGNDVTRVIIPANIVKMQLKRP